MATGPAPLVVLCGNIVWDTLLLVEEYPKPDTRTHAKEILESPGGECATAAAALARWGSAARLAGRIGLDWQGEAILSRLSEFGVDTSRIVRTPAVPTRRAHILVCRASGTRTIVGTRPPGHELAPGSVPLSILDGAGLLHLDGYHSDVALELAAEAKRRGIPVMWDASRVPPNFEELLALADYLVACEDFAHAVSRDLEALHNGRAMTAITRGPNGVDAIAGDQHVRQAALPAHVVDTTGAGDIFHAALDFAILRAWAPRSALRFAAAAGALACRTLGSMPSIPELHEVLGLAGMCESP
ncbi:hypothetical protein HZA57_08615 [Candidatus Poribacteria bacterium]|nr:hypothetical protein [Candidatus Poribacteria bacterium]